MSRNRNRVGGQAQNSAADPAPTMHEKTNDGFSFVIPTEFVELPSQGRYYPENHPLHGLDSVEIRHMTAKEEDILTSRTLLKKGIALDRVIQNLIVDKKVNPNNLFIGDKNALVIAARVSGYGNDYETKITCPTCNSTQDHNFDLNETKIYGGEDIGQLDVADNGDGTFNLVLPKTQVTVTFRLLTGNDERNLYLSMESDRKRKIDDRNVTKQLASMIVAVNNDDSVEAKRYLVENIPSVDSRHLRLAYKLASPNVDLTQFFECSECGFETEMEVPLTADFFWPKQ